VIGIWTLKESNNLFLSSSIFFFFEKDQTETENHKKTFSIDGNSAGLLAELKTIDQKEKHRTKVCMCMWLVRLCAQENREERYKAEHKRIPI